MTNDNDCDNLSCCFDKLDYHFIRMRMIRSFEVQLRYYDYIAELILEKQAQKTGFRYNEHRDNDDGEDNEDGLDYFILVFNNSLSNYLMLFVYNHQIRRSCKVSKID